MTSPIVLRQHYTADVGKSYSYCCFVIEVDVEVVILYAKSSLTYLEEVVSNGKQRGLGPAKQAAE